MATLYACLIAAPALAQSPFAFVGKKADPNAAPLAADVLNAAGASKADFVSLQAEIARALAAESAVESQLGAKCATDASACTVTIQDVSRPLSAWLAGNALLPPAASTIGGVLTGSLSWTVCASGCTFTNPLDAWNTARGIAGFGANASIVVRIADGTYSINDQFYTGEAATSVVQLIGNVANPGAVVLNFTNIAGTNFSGFVAQAGGRIGRSGLPGIDGVTLLGAGARLSPNSWAPLSYGAGVSTNGSGAAAYLGQHVVINGFYYSLRADHGSFILGDGGTYLNAGDVNVLARWNGTINAVNSIIDTAADTGTDKYGGTSVLGYNALAEAGGNLVIDGSTARNAQVAGIAALSNGKVWAHDTTTSGAGFAGYRATEGGMIEALHGSATGNGTGVYAETGGVVFLDAANVYANRYDGIQAGWQGRLFGDKVASHDNGTAGGGGIGIRVLAGGDGKFTNTRSLLTGNPTSDINVDIGTACTSPTSPCNPPSRLIIN